MSLLSTVDIGYCDYNLVTNIGYGDNFLLQFSAYPQTDHITLWQILDIVTILPLSRGSHNIRYLLYWHAIFEPLESKVACKRSAIKLSNETPWTNIAVSGMSIREVPWQNESGGGDNDDHWVLVTTDVGVGGNCIVALTRKRLTRQKAARLPRKLPLPQCRVVQRTSSSRNGICSNFPTSCYTTDCTV